MATKKFTKTVCDYCETEIEKGERQVSETIDLNGKQVSVEIKMNNADGKRFTADPCRNCVFTAAQIAAGQGLGEKQLTESL